MDITIPSHNLKRFTAAITCLGKIGKDLYVSFDPLDGLTLSSLNEAKSAFSKFHFEPGFFEQCNTPPCPAPRAPRSSNSNKHRNGGRNRLKRHDEGSSSEDEGGYDCRYVCRVPVRSVHSILRTRKGVLSVRIRSEGKDEFGVYLGLNRRRRNGRQGREQRRKNRDDSDEDGGNDSDGSRNKDKGVAASSSRRSRKRRKPSERTSQEDETPTISMNNDKMMLAFEFFIECYPTTNAQNSKQPPSNTVNGGVFRVLHKIGVTDAKGITVSATTHQRSTRSEIVSRPKLFTRLLDPLRRTAEVALTIDDELRVVTATSFHPGEVGVGEENNALLLAAAARNAVLKTETSTGCDEFDEYDFRNNRGKKKRRRARSGDSSSEDDEGAGEDENDFEFEDESDRPPVDVNQKVILVFGIKEAKAMLQFCSQTNSSFHGDGDALAILSFHWGGRPIVIETEGDFFSAELVLATLHHAMIASNISVGSDGRGFDDVEGGNAGGG